MTCRRHHSTFCAAVAVATALLSPPWDHVAAQPPRRAMASTPQTPPSNAAVAPVLAAKLTASYQAAVDGKPLRALLRQIAGAADFNLWIDRHIDPDQLVSLSGGPKTVFASLVEASRTGGAAVVAVGNVVLVGQRERIEQLAGAILAVPREAMVGSTPGEKKSVGQAEIRWPLATTPTAALRIVSPQTASELPHDHWPDVAWRDISPQVATLLVTAQFDLMPLGEGSVAGKAEPRKTLGQTGAEQPSEAFAGRQNASQSASSQFVRLAAPPVLTLRYPVGAHSEAIRSAATAADPRATLIEPRGASHPAAGSIELSGSPAAHVAAITAMLLHAQPRAAAGVDLDNVRFTLNLRGAPAHDVLVQLAAAAGRKLQVTEQATTMMRRTITFNVQDHSLRQLVKIVTDQIGASPQWSADTLTIIPSP